jgi:catechol 2,3-dioxygenase-like lactoylglutathione lyase family enzyme
MSPARNSNDAGYQVPDSILETAIYCDDLVAAGVFYEQIVGLTLFSHEPNRHRFYRVGKSMLLIFVPATTEQAEVRVNGQPIPQHGAHGPGHMAFAIDEDDVEPVRKRLAEFSVAVESEIDWPGGGHSIYCRDPGNNSIEFATRSLWFGAN